MRRLCLNETQLIWATQPFLAWNGDCVCFSHLLFLAKMGQCGLLFSVHCNTTTSEPKSLTDYYQAANEKGLALRCEPAVWSRHFRVGAAAGIFFLGFCLGGVTEYSGERAVQRFTKVRQFRRGQRLAQSPDIFPVLTA